MLGEHDFMDKRWMYDESMRMPFLVSYPAIVKDGRKNDLLINNTDFAPSMIELAGGIAPSYMQGMSFAKAVEGEEITDWRKATYYRYWMHLVHHDIPACFGVRTKEYKLIYYYSEHYDQAKYGEPTMAWKKETFPIESTPKAWELYDLRIDPDEVNNIYADPKYSSTVEVLKKELIRLRESYHETDVNYPHLAKVIEENW